MEKEESVVESGMIDVQGARVHNLKNIDVSIPRNKFTVITGLSGSGKSSLAFDTIFAEGQRRYIETFSSYARAFLGNLERPDVDRITGLSPVISIEQKTTNRSPRSTVGTITEIYDFFRLLYARAGEAFSYNTGEKMVKYSEEQILDLLMKRYDGRKVFVLAPIVRSRKGHYKELFEQWRKKGFLNVRVDGEFREIIPGLKLDRYKTHDIEIVIDKLLIVESEIDRVKQTVRTGMRHGDGLMIVFDIETGESYHFSRRLMCPSTGLSYSEPAPHSFSFNSPHGACPHCRGIGTVSQIDFRSLVPKPEKSIYQGGIIPLGKYRDAMIFWQIEAICEKYGISIKTPIKEIPEEGLNEILNGTQDRLQIKNESLGNSNYFLTFEGVTKYVLMQQDADAPVAAQKWAEQFIRTVVCPQCKGLRLNREALHYRIHGKNIAELTLMDLSELLQWSDEIEPQLDKKQKKIAKNLLREIRSRLRVLLDVRLEYLCLNRASSTLSGGESQRIRLATQIGTELINVIYVLDEPSIGLHQKDNQRMIDTLKQIRDTGNSVIVVEHDQEMMLSADYIVDLGPRAGQFGGEVVFSGTPDEMMQSDTLTADYLAGRRRIPLPVKRRKGSGKRIILHGAEGNNLKQIDVRFPLGKFICVTGVSGSGKSSLVNGTLRQIVHSNLATSREDPLPYRSVEGLKYIDKLVSVDQSPIGRTPRSNPATYTGVFGDIRNLFVHLPESKLRGYQPGRFSFNTPGGRCETCRGNGYKSIEMSFLPDVMIPCEECLGKRYHRETLEVRYRGKSIADVLDMTIDRAVRFFGHLPVIFHKIKVLQDVGLGYIKLGQAATTLSGGESQRVKLATELAKRDTGNTLYLLDEPTTGLHFEDIHVLLHIINRLVDKGNTMVIIEHNLEVIKCADYIIELGPEGGRNGGQVLFQGSPEEMVRTSDAPTAAFLKSIFNYELGNNVQR